MTFDENGAVVLAILICAVVLFAGYAVWRMDICPFLRKRRFLLTQMKNADDDEKYAFWKEELKKSYLRCIPVIGRFLVKDDEF